MKKSSIYYSKNVYQLLFVAFIGVCVLSACDTKTTQVEKPTDSLIVAPVDTVKANNGGTTVTPLDTVPKVDTPVAVVPVSPQVTTPNNANNNSGGRNGNGRNNGGRNTIKNPTSNTTPALPPDFVENPDQTSLPEGGYPAFYKFVRENLKYPEQAIKDGVEGRVSLQFVVSSDGSISHIKVIQGIGAGCDEEAVRIVKQSPKWQPAIFKGKKVSSKASTPIIFKIK